MKQQVLPSGETPSLVIEMIEGSLVVRGWARPEVQITVYDDAMLTVDQDETQITLRCDGDCRVQVPHLSTLHVRQVAGNAEIQAVLGAVEVDAVAGNLRLRTVGPTTLGQVEGNLTVRQVDGDLNIQLVGGDAAINEVQGEIEAERIESNLALKGGEHSVTATVGGNAALQVMLPAGAAVRIQAEGNIACQLAPDASAIVQLRGEGHIVTSGLNMPTRQAQGELAFTLGAGEATLSLQSGGNLALSSWTPPQSGDFDFNFDFDFGQHFGPEFSAKAAAFAQQVAGQFERQVENVTRSLDAKFAHLGGGEAIAARVNEKVQKAVRQAEEKIAAAMRQAERRVQEAERRAADLESRHRRHPAGWPATPPPPPAPNAPKAKAAPAAEEERKMILRMVSEGKLSVEQAEQLLAAMAR